MTSHLEYVPYILYVGACYITSQQERVQRKECGFMLSYTLLALFVVFSQRFFVFIIFISLFACSIEFPQQIINQSETRIGDKKLSVELQLDMFVRGSQVIIQLERYFSRIILNNVLVFRFGVSAKLFVLALPTIFWPASMFSWQVCIAGLA